MARSYSEDFRRKVLQAIELDGLKKQEARELFNISRNPIHQWQQLKSETGDIQPKPRSTSGSTAKITDWEAFRAFAYRHRDQTQAEMAALWPEPISQRTMSRALQKIGFTRKKRPTAIANAMRPNALPSRPKSVIREPRIEWMSTRREWMSETLMAMVMPRRGSVSTTSNPANARGASTGWPAIGELS